MTTEARIIAALAAEQLRWAEINEYWAYMEALLWLLREMGAQVIRLEDPRFTWRADYLVHLSPTRTLPGL